MQAGAKGALCRLVLLSKAELMEGVVCFSVLLEMLERTRPVLEWNPLPWQWRIDGSILKIVPPVSPVQR